MEFNFWRKFKDIEEKFDRFEEEFDRFEEEVNKMKKRFTIYATFIVILAVLCTIGWGVNLVKLIKCDFEPSYKEEIIRGVGVILPPVGAIVGIFPSFDEKK